MSSTSAVIARVKESRQLVWDEVAGTWVAMTQPGSAAGSGLTDAELRASPIEVEVISMPVGGSGLTDAELRATPVPVAATQSGVWDEVGINDSGNSITVDNAALSVVGGGTEATAQRVTIASNSTGVLSVDDNGANLSIDDGGNSITVDGTVAVSGGTIMSTQSGVWVVNITDGGDSITVDGALTNGELRATPVDIDSGSQAGTSAFASIPLFPLGAIDDDLATWFWVNSKQAAPIGYESGLIVRNIPSGTQNVSVVSGSTTVADVVEVTDDAGYVDGAAAENLTQTPEGFLRVAVAALVSDAVESYITGAVQPLSMTSEGRLRVSSVPAAIPTQEDVTSAFSFTGNPYDFLDTISPWD